MMQKFRTTLYAKGPGGGWTFMPIPFDVNEVFGAKGRVAVSGTVNGFAFRNSLMPEGDGTHAMMFSKELQAGAKARAGDTVTVVLDKDEAERVVETPDDLAKALRKDKKANVQFSTLTYSQKKEYVDWILSAKQSATREGRITKALLLLADGRKRIR